MIVYWPGFILCFFLFVVTWPGQSLMKRKYGQDTVFSREADFFFLNYSGGTLKEKEKISAARK